MSTLYYFGNRFYELFWRDISNALQFVRKNKPYLNYLPKKITDIDKLLLEMLALKGPQNLYQLSKQLEEKRHSRSAAFYSLKRLTELSFVEVYVRKDSKTYFGLTPLGLYFYIILSDNNVKDLFYKLDSILEKYPRLLPIFSIWKSNPDLRDFIKRRLFYIAIELAISGFLLSAGMLPDDLKSPQKVNEKLKQNFWAYFFTLLSSPDIRIDKYSLRLTFPTDSFLNMLTHGFKEQVRLQFYNIASLLDDMVNVYLTIPYRRRLKLSHALTLLKLKMLSWLSRIFLVLL